METSHMNGTGRHDDSPIAVTKTSLASQLQNGSVANGSVRHSGNEDHIVNGYTTTQVTTVKETAQENTYNSREAKTEQHTNSEDGLKNGTFPVDSMSTPQKPEGKSLATEQYIYGPDQVIPSSLLWTSNPDGTTKLKIGERGMSALPPVSVPGLLIRTANKYPDHVALGAKIDGEWKKWTYKEYLADVRTVAKAFIKLGLERFHAVCILGFNSPQWFISDLGAIFAGGFAAGIYTTNTAEACFYCAENSRANIIIVEDQKQLSKILEVRSRLPKLCAIIQYDGEPNTEGVYSWSNIMKIGEEEPDTLLEDRLKSIAVNQCCTLVYTSGTTGSPKAVMLSHDNLTWDAICVAAYLEIKHTTEVIISFLPLSHVAAQVVDIYITIACGASVYFADKDALRGSLLNTLVDVRPTKFLGVPRVWEKIYEKMMDVARSNGRLKSSIAAWAKSHGLQHNLDRMNGNEGSSFFFNMANWLIFKRVRKALGLDRCNIFMSAAAPLSLEVSKYFMSLDISVMEAYGMSEASGAHTVGTDKAFRIGSVGKTIPGMYTKLHNQEPDGQGEVCMGGRHVFMGYLGSDEKTIETFDEDGWLHSGDIGKVDNDGFLFITGRIKELIITAGGENVAPVLIEDELKAALPSVSHAMLVGDRRKFLSVLLTLKTEIDPDTGEPTDVLSKTALDWCVKAGSTSKSVKQIIEEPDDKVNDAIYVGLKEANLKAISNAQRIQKFAILPKDFSIAGGELGPTMKMKRNVIAQRYSDTIEKLYET